MKRALLIMAILLVSMTGGYLVSRSLENNRDSATAALGTEATLTQSSEKAAAENRHPEFSLQDLTGNTKTLADWQGKIRLINFWATWCAPCRREIPLLKRIQEEHASDGIQILGIAIDDVDAVAAYAKEMQFNYPLLLGDDDAMAKIETSFGVPFLALPFTFIVGGDGEFLNTQVGEISETEAETLLAILAELRAGRIDNDTARKRLAEL